MKWIFCLLLLAPLGKKERFQKEFAPLAKKLALYTANLHLNGEKQGYVTILKGKYGVTSASLWQKGEKEIFWGQKKLEYFVVGTDRERNLLFLYFPDLPASLGFSLSSSTLPSPGTIALSIAEGKVLQGGIVSAFRPKVYPVKKRAFFSIYGFLGLSGKGIRRFYKDVLQHDAPPGKRELGGPLVGRQGELLGVNVAYVYRGTGFAISSVSLFKVFSKLKKQGVPLFGIWLRETKQGLFVVKTAQKKGKKLQRGDYIQKVGGVPVSQISSFWKLVRGKKKVELTLRRQGKILKVWLSLKD